MALDPNGMFSTGADRMTRAQAEKAEIDVGLRAYMLRVYNYMASGLAITGLLAYITYSTPALLHLLYTPAQGGAGYQPTILAWIVMISPLAFIMALSFGINRMKASTAQLLFWVFSGVMGLSLSNIFLAYTSLSITRVFFITAATFGAMSLWGYTTQRDLTGMGSFLFMGLIGIIIAMVVNIFLASSALQFAISVIGVLVFTGLTAYDTQKIKEMYYVGDDGTVTGRKAIMGALRLYLDFINLFLMLLRLFGNSRG
jgi:FtsH-binding integral membrane protein